MENQNYTKEEKCSITQKGRIVIHKNDEEKRIYLEELQQFLDEGWERGFSKSHHSSCSKAKLGKTPPNKGKPCSKETREKISHTLKEKHYKPWQCKDDDATKEKFREATKKGTLTKKQRYGNGFGVQNMNDEHKQNISRALKNRPSTQKGVKRPSVVGEHISQAKKGYHHSQETKDKISRTKTGVTLTKDKLEIKCAKQYETKKHNNTFNTSVPEEEHYLKLQECYKGKTILRQYKDKERYPFYCDFYIVEDDLFIEVNAHWSHGGHPFNPNDPLDIETLNHWKEKAKTSKFYANAIETWTIRDVKKQECAKKNKLNYITLY